MDYAAARLNMVESQIRPNRVTDPAVIGAMLAVPREQFVPETLRAVAYVDEDIPIGNCRFLMEPMVFARLVQAARITPADAVLEIGAGTGYGSAILARLARAVIAIESDPALVKSASHRLADLAVRNVIVAEGPLAAGHARAAPYNAIIISGAVQRIPEAVSEQLAEGGRLVGVVSPPGGAGKAVLATRVGGIVSTRVIFDAGTPLLPGFELEPGFVF